MRIVPYQTVKCPDCGGVRVRVMRTRNHDSFIRREHQCGGCGKRFLSDQPIDAANPVSADRERRLSVTLMRQPLHRAKGAR